MRYPRVLGEVDTLHEVCTGLSLARYGDGEFALCRGLGIPCQRAETLLQSRLQGILRSTGPCLIGIPNIHSATPKATYWAKYQAAADLLVDRPYVSAFVSRPDSAPWIDTPSYWALLESLWLQEEVVLVRGTQRSLTADDLVGARHVTEVLAPVTDAWADHERVLAQVRAVACRRVLLCLGPTATVMAVELAAEHYHAIDLGHIGLFLRKHRRGEPMIRTAEDKVLV